MPFFNFYNGYVIIYKKLYLIEIHRNLFRYCIAAQDLEQKCIENLLAFLYKMTIIVIAEKNK